MKQTAHNQLSTAAAIRFKRWSRKGYAAFISVQQAVTIGQLRANVSERFQIKNGAVHTSVLSQLQTVDEKENNTDECSLKNLWDTINEFRLLLASLFVQVNIQQIESAHAYTLIQLKYSEKAGSSVYGLELPAFLRLYPNEFKYLTE